MRLWHTKLISVLPREQLVSTWRELSAIAGNIQKKGTPKHILVNFVLDYDFNHFISYAADLRKEMTSRGYRTANTVWDKIVNLKPDWVEIPFEDIYKEKMNDEYLKICYYNLYEKHLCGGIKSTEWMPIHKMFYSKMH